MCYVRTYIRTYMCTPCSTNYDAHTHLHLSTSTGTSTTSQTTLLHLKPLHIAHIMVNVIVAHCHEVGWGRQSLSEVHSRTMQTLRHFNHRGVHQTQNWSLVSHPLLHIMANTLHLKQCRPINCHTGKIVIQKKKFVVECFELGSPQACKFTPQFIFHQLLPISFASGRDCWRIVRQIEVIDIITSFCVFVWCSNTPTCQFTCRGLTTNYPIHSMECLTCAVQHHYDSGFAPATCTDTTTTN